MKKHKIDIGATLLTVLALCLFSIGPNFVKQLSFSMDGWSQNFFRYIVACLFWLPLLLRSVKDGRADRRIWRLLFWPSVANVIMQSFWALAFYHIDPGFAVLLSKSSLIWTALFAMFFFADERALLTSKRFWCGLLLTITGLIGVVVFKKDFTAKSSVVGILLILSSGFTWAIYLVSIRRALKDYNPLTGFSVICVYTVAGLGLLAFLFGRPMVCMEISPKVWVSIVVSGLVGIAFSHACLYGAIKRIGATIPSLILLAQPFGVLAISRVIFGERMNPLQWLSGFVLVAGAAMAVWAQGHLSIKK